MYDLFRKCSVVEFSIAFGIHKNCFERFAQTKFIERLTLTNK